MVSLQNPIHVIVGGYFEGDSSWSSSRSMVDNCFKVYYVTRGELWIKDKEQTYFLESGKIYLINGHKLEVYGANSFDVYWFHFIPHQTKLYSALNLLDCVTEMSDILLNKVGSFSIFHSQNFALADNSDLLYSLKFQCMVHEIIIEALSDSATLKGSNDFNSTKIDKAIEYIDKNFTKPINLDELAEMCNLSASHFHKLFTKIVNVTPKNYIIAKRLTMSLTLINMGENIKQIAFDLGFCDDAHFSRIFKNYYGFTPGYYKKNANININF